MIYFWGTEPPYGILSNFAYTPFIYKNYRLKWSEQSLMLEKCLMFDPSNHELLNQILNANSPKDVKKFGRMVRNFDEKKWERSRYDIMRDALIAKFEQNEYAKNILLNTGNQLIAEASPYDKIWGIGINARQASAGQQWDGRNLLGTALMEVRSILQNINTTKNFVL